MRQVGEQRLAPLILVYFIANMAVEVAIGHLLTQNGQWT